MRPLFCSPFPRPADATLRLKNGRQEGKGSRLCRYSSTRALPAYLNMSSYADNFATRRRLASEAGHFEEDELPSAIGDGAMVFSGEGNGINGAFNLDDVANGIAYERRAPSKSPPRPRPPLTITEEPRIPLANDRSTNNLGGNPLASQVTFLRFQELPACFPRRDRRCFVACARGCCVARIDV